MHIDPYIVLGSAIVGLLVGMTGAGGGALMTPMLILLFGVAPSTAISSDLVAAFVMRPIGAAVHLRAGTVNLRLVRWMVIGSVPAAFLGAYLLHLLGNAKSAQTHIETALGVALLVGAGAMVLRFFLDRRGGHRRTALVHEVVPRPAVTVVIGVLGGLIVGMTSVGSGSLMIVLLLFVYPAIGANQLVGTDLTQAVPLTLAAALGALAFGHIEVGVTASLILGSVPAVLDRFDALVKRAGPLRAAGDRVRDLRLRPEVRRRRHNCARLDPLHRAARRRLCSRGCVVTAAARGARGQLSRAMRTGACVGAVLPPAGSGVTIIRLTPWRFPGTSTEPDPVAVRLNSAVVGCGRPVPRWSHTS